MCYWTPRQLGLRLLPENKELLISSSSYDTPAVMQAEIDRLRGELQDKDVHIRELLDTAKKNASSIQSLTATTASDSKIIHLQCAENAANEKRIAGLYERRNIDAKLIAELKLRVAELEAEQQQSGGRNVGAGLENQPTPTKTKAMAAQAKKEAPLEKFTVAPPEGTVVWYKDEICIVHTVHSSDTVTLEGANGKMKKGFPLWSNLVKYDPSIHQ